MVIEKCLHRVHFAAVVAAGSVPQVLPGFDKSINLKAKLAQDLILLELV
ncbi:MAG: hypothetical protein AAFY26_17960 [Cyanobacteria bacterium J06638_22]